MNWEIFFSTIIAFAWAGAWTFFIAWSVSRVDKLTESETAAAFTGGVLIALFLATTAGAIL